MSDNYLTSIIPEELKAEIKSYALKFNGTAKEYFRIWIVNIFLTIITVGIYAAWAKVRTRQYLYASTTLEDQSFDYTGNPIAILKGNLIIGAGFLAYYFTNAFKPHYAGFIMIGFYIVLPLLIYKSLKFNAKNSVYRNIRFRFLGTLWGSYKTYLLYPLLILLTLRGHYPILGLSSKTVFLQQFYLRDSKKFI